ncbi:MAG: hypothetical protein AAB847_00540, partial [Patescibacteria group bacterium]
MKNFTFAVAVSFVFVVSLVATPAAAFSWPWQKQEPPKTSQKKDDLLPVGQKFTGKNVIYNRKEGDRRMFFPNTNYGDKNPSFMLVDSEERWLSVQLTLKGKHPLFEKVNMEEDIVLVAFGGKRDRKYRQI